MKSVLVTGAAGQLASAIKAIAADFKELHFFFASSQELDITNPLSIKETFAATSYDLVINTAAYTAVDKAESEADKAYAVNALGVKYLAEATGSLKIPFIHISTDYVFDGQEAIPRLETDLTNPIGVYGSTKLAGEAFALQANPHTIIIRTAWVYSEYGTNFVKTMLRLFNEKEEIGVINDQIGSPTNANDLARAILQIATSENLIYGIFNYSNEGQCSWFDFATKIKQVTHSPIIINPITSSAYVTAAKRPAYSLLNKEKIQQTYDVVVPEWSESLEVLLHRTLLQ